MAFLAPLLPEAAALAGPAVAQGAEMLGASLIGKEATEGLKKIANVGLSHLTKEVSPSQLLHKVVNSGAKVLADPKKVAHVFESGHKALNIATGGAKHFTDFAQKHKLISDSRAGKWRASLGRVNHGFHSALGKLSKVHKGLVPFLHR